MTLPSKTNSGEHPDIFEPLTSPERPRFFCGQLLGDEDLSAIVEWAAAKARLQRFHRGWGVVTGLYVRPDETQKTNVVVGTGYGLNSAGYDVVVAGEQSVDLSEAYLGAGNCSDVSDLVQAARDRRSMPKASPEQLAKLAHEVLDVGNGAPRGSAEDERQHVAVDLFIDYDEREAGLRASLNHSDCVEAAACEPTKIKEVSRIWWEHASPDPLPDDLTEARWRADYDACTDVVSNADELDDTNGAAIRRRIDDWITDHPPAVFAGMRDQVAGISEQQLREDYPGILLRLALDCRVHHARTRGRRSSGRRGIRLARVHLVGTDGSPGRVESIDSSPPHRQEVSSGVHSHGQRVNIVGLIGMSENNARAELLRLGLTVGSVTVATVEGSDLTDLKRLFANKSDVDADPDRPVDLVVAHTGGAWFDDRVISVQAAAAEPGPGEPDPMPPSDPSDPGEPEPVNPEPEDPAEPEDPDPSDPAEPADPAEPNPEEPETPEPVSGDEPMIRAAEPVASNLERLQLIDDVGPATAKKMEAAGITPENLVVMTVEDLAEAISTQLGRAGDIMASARTLFGT